jgi:dihydroorotate dehydrogenase (fumarate)
MSVDLTARYLGLALKNPLVVAACSLTGKLDTLKRLEDAGAAAVVLPSLFEEQIEHDQMAVHDFYERTSEAFPEAITFFPEVEDYNAGPDTYLRHVGYAKKALSIPVVGSLNGTSVGGWVRYARLIEEAGADALELNVYFVATDPDETSAQVETRYAELVAEVRRSVSIPLAVKVGPFFSALPYVARRLVAAGADGLVLFNRFLQPDIALDTLRVEPRLVLSTSDELRLPLRWVAILRPHLKSSLAANGGIHTPEDVLKVLLAGADVAMLASALYKHGPGHLGDLLDGARRWLEEHEYTSVQQMRGSLSRANAPDPAAFERANYIKTLVEFSGGAPTALPAAAVGDTGGQRR